MYSSLHFYMLCTATMLERMAWYGFRSVLVIYLVELLGSGIDAKNQALEWTGWTAGLTYLFPILIGIWATRPSICQLAVILGCALLITGYLALASRPSSFFWALILIIAGRSGISANLRAMVGDVVRGTRVAVAERAFSNLYVFANLGSLCGIVTSGLLYGAFADYSFAMAACALEIVLCLSIVVCASSFQSVSGETAVSASKPKKDGAISGLTRYSIIILITLLSAVFWTGFEQKSGSLNLYAHEAVDNGAFGFQIQPTWYQSVNPLLVVLLGPVVIYCLRQVESRRKHGLISPFTKLGLGLILLGASYIFFAGVEFWRNGKLASPLVLIALYFLHTLGELFLEPIGQSLVNRLAPSNAKAFCLALWDGGTFIAILLAGYLPILLSGNETNVSRFLPLWVFLAVSATTCGIALWACSRFLTSKVQPLLTYTNPNELKSDDQNDKK